MGKKIDLDDLSDEEKARLPGRIRAMDRDAFTTAWAKAKAERDAALEAAESLEPEARADAVAAARAAWADTKAELLASAPAAEE